VVSLLQIDAFNVEEVSFGWQTTVYPQRQATVSVLRPYLQLYETIVDFSKKHEFVVTVFFAIISAACMIAAYSFTSLHQLTGFHIKARKKI